MKKGLIITVVVLALGGIVAASVLRKEGDGKGDKVYAEAVERRSISQIVKASGQVDPRVKVNVSAHVVARIEELFVEEGDEVEKGQPFLRLEQVAFEAARQRAEAQLEIARSLVLQSDIDLADSELKLRRSRRLANDSVLSSEALEGAVLAQRSAGLRKDQAEEAVRQARADLEKAEDDLQKTTIYSPITGRIITLEAEEGEVVVSGTMNNPASIIGTVADLSEILVEVNVDENDIVDVALGQSAAIVVDALAEEEFEGRVVEIGSSGFSRPQQPDVTFFKVKILLEAPDARLRPGMSARTEIEVTTHEHALVIPIQAVVYRLPLDLDGDTEEKVVFAAVDGSAAQVPVQVGVSDTTHAEILSGLEEGQLVITGPHRILKNLEHEGPIRVDDQGPTEGDDGGDDD